MTTVARMEEREIGTGAPASPDCASLHPGYGDSPAPINKRKHHETTDDSERTQPQPSRRAGAAYLRHHDAFADQGELREGRWPSGAGTCLSPIEPRGRTGRLDPEGKGERGRHHH